MAGTDMVFRFAQSTDDTRTFRVYQVIGTGEHEELELYKFSHSMTGSSGGTTTYHRKNMNSLIFEAVGQISWNSNTIATTVYFGLEEVSVKDLRKVKNATSHSRRFKSGADAVYKWKISDNRTDLYCIDSQDKYIASWSNHEKILRVTPRASAMLDRLVVTCFLNVWFKRLGRW
ncbi:hypothetical protein DEU56DRAFT_785634 [Suillus clintonianus]|uniref:uncharacterized protein n=1 Tax=Suillus clintonianus TaxID=1904413 RepID=UPI001B85E3C1|nr:uncharacterized protein DEU56DRAFT_785634 [Suillus clintonianus]KAG2146647.1 hypothetical protein DEU56DRAFT_785634 [Suillus clintonianus]